jgi:hypothetical protein
MDTPRPLSTLIIRDLMFETIRDTEFCQEHSQGYDFLNARGAHQDNLFMLVELMAIEKGLIDGNIAVNIAAWGALRHQLFEGRNTNFNVIEIERLWEAFYMLLNNYILAPGMYRNSPELPYFHVTEHGRACINSKDILPYDIDGYMKKLRDIEGIDEWVEFYMLEALKCYNANCYNATTAMIGLSSEVLVELLIKEFSTLLGKTRYNYEPKRNIQLNGKTLKEYFDDKIKKETKISRRYEVFSEIFQGVKNLQDELINTIDASARDSFFTFLRLNRNEVAHCMEVKKDSSETLLLFMGFIKYCSLITKLLNKMRELNS